MDRKKCDPAVASGDLNVEEFSRDGCGFPQKIEFLGWTNEKRDYRELVTLVDRSKGGYDDENVSDIPGKYQSSCNCGLWKRPIRPC